jgi:hypothetical protein
MRAIQLFALDSRCLEAVIGGASPCAMLRGFIIFSITQLAIANTEKNFFSCILARTPQISLVLLYKLGHFRREEKQQERSDHISHPHVRLYDNKSKKGK